MKAAGRRRHGTARERLRCCDEHGDTQLEARTLVGQVDDSDVPIGIALDGTTHAFTEEHHHAERGAAGSARPSASGSVK